MKLKIAPYFRVSTQSQKEDDTVHRQILTFEEQWSRLSNTFDLYERVPGGRREDQYFKDEGYNLEEWNTETDFHRLMALIQTAEIDAIYVDEENRLFRARSREFRGRVLDIIEQNEIRVITKNGEVSTGSLAMEIVSAVGADDKRAMLRKCHEAKIARLTSEGRPPTGRSPFGLNWNKKEKKWELVQEEALIIKCAVGLAIGKVYEEMPSTLKALAQLHVSGMTDKEVAVALTSVGFSKTSFPGRILGGKTARTGIDYGGIKAIFASDTCRGTLMFNLKKPEHVGNPRYKDITKAQKLSFLVEVPKILSDEDWSSLCLKRAKRRKWAKRNVQHEYLCKDLLICTECGIPMASRPKDTERYIKRERRVVKYPSTLYYTCARKQKTSGFRCSSNKCHSVALVDELVWNKVVTIAEQPEFFLNKYREFILDSEKEATSERLKEAELSLTRELKKLKATSVSLAILLGKCLISIDAYSIADTENKKEQLRVVHDIEEIRDGLKRESFNTHEVEQIIQSVSTVISNATFSERREILFSLLAKIKISAQGEICIFLKTGISIPI